MLLKLRFLQPMDWKSPLVFPLCHSRSIRSRSTLLLVALKWCFYAAHAANIQSWYMEITFSVGERFYQLQNMLVITGKKMDFWSYGAELGPGGPFDSRTFCSYPGTFWFHPRTLFWLVTSSGHYTVYMYCVRVQYVLYTVYMLGVYTARAEGNQKIGQHNFRYLLRLVVIIVLISHLLWYYHRLSPICIMDIGLQKFKCWRMKA